MSKQTDRQRLIVVSNRLPFSVKRDDQGKINIQPGSGGLITAMLPVLRDRGGTWIGWMGESDSGPDVLAALRDAPSRTGYTLVPVTLTADEVRDFYLGFSNEVIWPLFHDLQSLCHFKPIYWRAYRAVNQKFAHTITESARLNDFIWVHDYHLMHVGLELRQIGLPNKLGFFLHIPFPPLDIFVKLPWRFEILKALLQFDLLGFQTMRDRTNFAQCVRALLPEVRLSGKGQVLTARLDNREVRIGNFPISIDFKGLVKRAASEQITRAVADLKALLPDRQLILGVDRLDYTKGIPNRLEALRDALRRYPELREHITLIQVVVPSREDITQYNELKNAIERLVGEINGEFTRPGGWVPIHYVFRNLPPEDLLSYYRAAQIALVTPLKDGMNLVSKEYCACSIEKDCVLILSEFAGAAAQLENGAILVNPYDVEGVADALVKAFRMPLAERRTRMIRMRKSIREYDIFWWMNSYLRAAIAQDLDAFPAIADYVPKPDDESNALTRAISADALT